MHVDVLVVGCGLAGAVTARFLAEEMGKKVLILERRNHIGGNMYDCKDPSGILVHLYGPHTFHTNKKFLFEYMQRFGEWEEYHLACGAEINGKYTPTPFNFRTIDDFFGADEADKIKGEIRKEYGIRTKATIVEMLESENDTVRKYAQFLFQNDYSLYTAKQWGILPSEIDVSVLKRVPVEFSYREGYFQDKYQFMPKVSYVEFFRKLLEHKNIEIKLGMEALDFLSVDRKKKYLLYKGIKLDKPVVYTGAIDELLGGIYGRLPYRSLRFEWKTLKQESYQPAPVVAYPQAPGYTRITEYKKLPVQHVAGITTIAVEYPLPYQKGKETEPYYPILTRENQNIYEKYRKETEDVKNLYLCGRLADYKYYNMDQTLESAIELCKVLKEDLRREK